MINKLQDMYISMFTPFIRYSNRLSERFHYYGLTVCFVINIIMFCIVELVLRKENYFYNSFCGILLLFVIIFLSLDKELKRIPWRRGICFFWFLTCILMTISDVLIPKETCGLGLILGFLFTGVFFVWQNNSRRDLLWKAFKTSLRVTFDFMALVSFLFRPYFEGGRYAGVFTNPNTFGLYLTIIFCIFLSDMDWYVETNRPIRKQILSYMRLALVLFYVSVSQARTAMIAVVATFVCFIICRIIIDKKRKCHRPFLKALACMLIITGVLYPVYFFALSNLPGFIGHPIVYHDDTLYMQSGEKIEDVGDLILKEEARQKAEREAREKERLRLQSKENKGSDKEAATGSAVNPEKNMPLVKGNKISKNNVLVRFIDTLIISLSGGKEGDGMAKLNQLSSGRMTIYSAYKDDLNILGHKRISKKINGHVVAHAHNNWLQFGYTYGIPAMLSYTALTILAFIWGIRFFFYGHRKYASFCLLPCAIIVSFLAATMTECLFQPFEVYPAFAFWFSFGEIFMKEKEEERRKK